MAVRKKIKVKIEQLKSVQLIPNEGQMKGLPANPRFIRDKSFEELKKSITDDPEMMDVREVVVYPFNENYIIIMGNMRYRALVDLGIKQIPCKILPKSISIRKLKALTVKDNVHHGKDDWEVITEQWDIKEVEGWGKVLPIKPLNESDEEKKTNIKITITDVNKDERSAIKELLTKAGYKVK